MRPPLLLLLVCALAATTAAQGCGPKVATPTMTRAECQQEINQSFGPQQSALLALRARDGGPLFRTRVLEAVDRVCQAFEDKAIDDRRAVKCLTTVPIMYPSAMGARVLVAREELPFTVAQSLDFQRLVLQLEFARGDMVDPRTGGMVTYIHLPLENFEPETIRKVFDTQSGTEASTLTMELDDATGETPRSYQQAAAGGPSSAAFFGLYDSGTDGGLKEPATLIAIDRFQAAAETLPLVAQTFSIADVVKLVRRGLRRGMVGEAFIPPVRAEISQLLLALSMSPIDGGFGPTMDSRERVAILRINLKSVGPEQKRRLGQSLERLLAQQVQPGARAFLCFDE
jgi:hypothetical protein